MVAAGFLRLDIGGFGGLGITDKGGALLHGDGAFIYREDTAVSRSPAKTQARSDGRAEPPLTGGEAKLKQFAGPFLAAIDAALSDGSEAALSGTDESV